MKRVLLSLVVAAMFVFSIQFAAAAVPGGATISNWVNNGHAGAPNPDSQSVTAGDIYQGNLNTTQNTYRWAGVFGNVTGKIVLKDGSSTQPFYTWNNADGVFVYASEASSIAWSSLAPLAVSNIPSFLNSGATDNFNNTFSLQENFNSPALGTVNNVNYTTLESGTWKTYALEDGSSSVWAATVTSGTAYNGSAADYEVLIPEDGTSGDTTPTTYYFYVELQ